MYPLFLFSFKSRKATVAWIIGYLYPYSSSLFKVVESKLDILLLAFSLKYQNPCVGLVFLPYTHNLFIVSDFTVEISGT